MSFSDLGLLPELLRAVADKGYDTPSPIQIQAIPAVLAGRDVLAGAQTGTGKTAGFVLPILQRLAADTANGASRAPRALVLTPTRELAAQVAQSARDYGKYMPLRTYQVFGGVSINPQITALRSGCDILVATPGRLLDLAQQRWWISPRCRCWCSMRPTACSTWVSSTTSARSSNCCRRSGRICLFSATYSDDIRGLAERLLHNPLSIQVAPRNAPIELVEQRAYRVQKEQKRHLLVHLIQEGQWRQVLIFTRTKHGANRLDSAAGRRRHSGRRDPWQQEPGRAREGARHVQARPGHLLGRHRSGGARPRHQGAAAGRQLRAAQCAGRLRASHRPHRPRRLRGRSDFAGLER